MGTGEAAEALALGIERDDPVLVGAALRAGAGPTTVVSLALPRARGKPLRLTVEAWFGAAILGSDKAVGLMLQAGASVSTPGPSGLSALHYAASHLRQSTAEMLIAAGADPRLADTRGRTPLGVLRRPRDPGARGRARAIRLSIREAGGLGGAADLQGGPSRCYKAPRRHSFESRLRAATER